MIHAAAHGDGTGTSHEPVFVGEVKAKLEALFPKYPTKQACLLPALWMVQESRGWISEAVDGRGGRGAGA